MARRGEVTTFSRDRRRPPRWSMGLPRRRPPGPLTRFLQRAFSLRSLVRLTMMGAVALLVLLPLIADLVNAAMKPVAGESGTCRILRLVDGDTVTLMCPEEGMESARLTGFDTPEKFSAKCLGEFMAAERATWALRTLIQRAERLRVVHEGRDRYGRALVRLELDGVDVARLMVQAGHARVYAGGLRGGWC